MDQSTRNFFHPTWEGVVVDKLLYRFSTCGCVPETFAIKVESCQKSRKILDDFLALLNVWGQAFLKFLHALQIDQALLAHTGTGRGPPKKN